MVGNDVSGNPEAGILSFDLIDGLLAGNTASGNGVGILLDSGADQNEVRGNEASGNAGGDGFGIIVFESTGNLLADNVANANDADGIRIEEEEPGAGAGNTLTRNVASRNGGHGIVAVAGTIDGGGNRARANATPPDCVGVACS